MPKRSSPRPEEGEPIPPFVDSSSRSYTDTVGSLTGFLSSYSDGLEDSAAEASPEANLFTVVALADGAEAKSGITRGGQPPTGTATAGGGYDGWGTPR